MTDSASHELSRVLTATTTDKAGNTENILYTYGNGLVAQENGKEYLLYHFNHLGSTTAVTDASGKIKYTYTYNIFGKLLSGNYGEVEFLYNGQYGVTSDANGLYYMRARYYNIDIMRFINQDILTGSIDSSQSLNRYAYVEGNPVNFLDPFGLEAWDVSWVHTLVLCVDIAFATTGVIMLATGGILGLVQTATIYSKVSKVLSWIDTAAYVYEYMTAKTEYEKTEALVGLSIAGIGKILEEGLNLLKVITVVVDNNLFEQLQQLIGYVYSTLSDSSNAILNEIERVKGKK